MLSHTLQTKIAWFSYWVGWEEKKNLRLDTSNVEHRNWKRFFLFVWIFVVVVVFSGFCDVWCVPGDVSNSISSLLPSNSLFPLISLSLQCSGSYILQSITINLIHTTNLSYKKIQFVLYSLSLDSVWIGICIQLVAKFFVQICLVFFTIFDGCVLFASRTSAVFLCDGYFDGFLVFQWLFNGEWCDFLQYKRNRMFDHLFHWVRNFFFHGNMNLSVYGMLYTDGLGGEENGRRDIFILFEFVMDHLICVCVCTEMARRN